MCVTNGKIKVEVYLTPEELILLGKLLKGSGSVTVQALDGENGPPKPPRGGGQ